MMSGGKLVLGVALCLASQQLQAQVTVPEEYSKTIAHRSELGALTNGFAGENIDLSSGRLVINQTDVDLPGNNALPVRVSRRFEAANSYSGGHFGRWSLDIPSVHGVFFGTQIGGGWQSDVGGGRCSSFSAPPIVTYMGGTWLPDEYWHGTFFNLPGSGDQELLINEDSAHVPADGHEYPAVTKAGSVARCVQTDASATAANQGEGFEVVTQDGVIYTLNHMVLWNQPALKRATAGGMPSVAPTYNLPRWEYFLYPTKVMDRFGNTVDYIWNTSEPAQLLRIQSSDGRMIVFTYLADGSNRIASVSDGTRTWDYTYGPPGASGNSTDTVRLPDGTQWSYRLASLHHMINQPSTTAVNCAGVAGVTQRTGFDDGSSGTTYTGSITGPSGASVTFSLARVLFGRSHLAYNCVTDGDDSITARPADPYLFMSAAVVGKTITGPGLPAQGLHWSYVYGPTNNCWAGTYSQGVACTANSPTTRSVIVTDPDGSQTRYTFGNRANVDEGLLYTTESGWNGSGALRTTEITYAEPNTAPFGPFDGWSLRGNGDYAITSRIRPQRKVVTTQQGRSFVWEVASDCAGMPYCFDAFARPTRVIRSSTP